MIIPGMVKATDLSDPDDWHLAHLACDGNEDAYASLITRHQAGIHSFVFRHVGDVETARDLTQEVFVRAWFALKRARPSAKFSTWLFQIAINLCRDHAKSKTTRQIRLNDPLEHRNADGTVHQRDLPDSNNSPDLKAQQSELAEAIEAAITRLPTDLREAFLLGVIDDRPHKEIAEILKTSPKAVEVRIYRARKKLVEILSSAEVVE